MIISHDIVINRNAAPLSRARTTHIDDSDERKPIPVITSRFSSSEFLRESNHDEVPGTDMMDPFNNCQVSFIIGRSKPAPEISKRQPSSCSVERLLLRMILIERLLFLIIVKGVFFT